jgi:ATP diphosphatase
LQELLAIMRRLRAADGCPWDRAQTFASIAPHTIEEAYEVADAIERGDMAHLQDELGDLLFQVVFQAQLAEEAGHFNFEGVAAAIRDKLVRRHPHVFGPQSDEPPAGGLPTGGPPIDAAQTLVLWENIKAQERAATATGAAVTGALDGVPTALPALLRAVKLSKRAARVGFDFERAAETADKVAEELREVREAAAHFSDAVLIGDVTQTGGDAAVFEEVGDLLFAAANLARKLGVDAEAALRAANAKFERRFAGMERLARERDQSFETLSLGEQEALWQEVKRGE